MAKEQKEVEAEYLKMAKTDKPAADKMLNDFNLRIMADTEKLTEDLTNQLFTIRTKDIQSDIFFANAAKRLSNDAIVFWRKALISFAPAFHTAPSLRRAADGLLLKAASDGGKSYSAGLSPLIIRHQQL